MVIWIKTLAEQLSASFRSSKPAAARVTGDNSDTAVLGRSLVFWPDGAESLVETSCPSCGSVTGKPLHLTIEFETLPGIRRSNSLLRCPECTSLFYMARNPP